MEIDSGNTAWMLTAAAMVLFMTPGLGFFYGGLTRNKNVLATIMQSVVTTGVVCIIWVTVGYSLAFGPDWHGVIGNLDWIGLKDVGADTRRAERRRVRSRHPPPAVHGLPDDVRHHHAGAHHGCLRRTREVRPVPHLHRRSGSLLVYVPVAHWVFAYDGWLSAFSANPDTPDIGLNSLDFAGGMAIHVNAGVAALAAVFVFGKRKGYGSEPMEPHDITMVVLGAAILWFGWFGFNAGSAGGATGQAVSAFVNTNVAAATAGLTWVLFSWRFGGKPSVVGAAAGAVAGLVAVTPAAGFVQPMEAIVIGGVAGGLCYGAVRLRSKIGLDDSLDVIGVHGVGGVWGALATGIFANPVVSGLPYAEGLLHGDYNRFTDALIGIGAVGHVLLRPHLHHPQGPRHHDWHPCLRGRRRTRPRRLPARRTRLHLRRRRRGERGRPHPPCSASHLRRIHYAGNAESVSCASHRQSPRQTELAGAILLASNRRSHAT